MNKEELLTSITRASAAHTISQTDVLEAWQHGQGGATRVVRKKMSLTNILTGIGGIIVALGIVLLFQQHWQSFGVNMRIFVTLGFGIILYLAGALLYKTPSVRSVAWAMFLAFSLVTPFGIWVTFDSLYAQFPFFGYETVISLIMFTWFLASFFIFRLRLFQLAAVLSGSILYFGVTGDFLAHNPAIDLASAFEYRFLILGISYILLGFAGWMYPVGAMMFLGAAMGLGGYAPSANLFWEVVFPGLALGTMFMSIPLKNKSVLVVGSLYLMAYIIKITAEYFSNTLGWPIALILAGFALIGIGYGSLMLGKRYVTQARPVE